MYSPTFGGLLNREFTDAAEAYNAALMGVEGSLSDEENAAQEVQQYLADYLGQVYVEKHFSAEAKADVEAMIDEILEVYAQRIEKLDWMSETTKAKAIEKLEAMTCVCSVGLDMIAIPGDTTAATIAGIIADEAAIGMVNQKTTAVRLIPVIGKGVGEVVEFGGLLGYAPVMPVNAFSCEGFVARGGRIPAPIHSFKN